MHINLLFRKVLYVFFSFLIIIAPTIQMAQAASNWKPTSAKSSGSRVVIGATNGGYKSAINIPPNLGKIVKFGMKGANAVGLLQIAAGLLGEGVDYVLDPANNRIRYKVETVTDEMIFSSIDAYCKSVYGSAKTGGRFNKWFSDRKTAFSCIYDDGGTAGWFPVPTVSKERYLTLDSVAPQIVKDAQSSDTQKRVAAQKILQDVATAAVIAGDYDADLMAGAVPISGNETKPVIPAIPGSQVGDVDAGMQGGEVGAAAEQAREEADKARKQAEAAKDAATAAAEEARRLNDEAKDLINTNIDQAIKDAATAAAAQAAKDAADAKSVADAAAAEAARVASEAARAAEKAVAAADAKVAAAEQALADAKAEAAAAAAGDKAAADAKVAAAEQAAAAATSEAARANERAKEAEKAAEKAKEKAKESAKPFELPAFCSWATPVCDYIDWVKTEYSDMKSWVRSDPLEGVDENVDIQDSMIDGWQDKANAGYVSFSSQCPSDVLIPVELMGASQTLNISYAPFCHFASLIKPAVILGAWISGLLIISGGRGRE